MNYIYIFQNEVVNDLLIITASTFYYENNLFLLALIRNKLLALLVCIHMQMLKNVHK
jgi:hypothetical protein